MDSIKKASEALAKICNLWTRQDWETRELDELKELYKDYEVRFAIPNGGIVGVSIWALNAKAGWYLPTELHPDHKPTWYRDIAPNLELAKKGLKIIQKLLAQPKPRRPRKPKKTSNYEQLNLLDCPEILTPIAIKDSPQPIIAVSSPETIEPPVPKFAVGDVVIATTGRELKTHKMSPLTIIGFSQLGSPLIRLDTGHDWPVNPEHIRPATVEDFGKTDKPPEVTQVSAPQPVQKKGAIYKEWRWWESTRQWTFTGAMGFTITAKHPNSSLFEASIDPNELSDDLPW